MSVFVCKTNYRYVNIHLPLCATKLHSLFSLVIILNVFLSFLTYLVHLCLLGLIIWIAGVHKQPYKILNEWKKCYLFWWLAFQWWQVNRYFWKYTWICLLNVVLKTHLKIQFDLFWWRFLFRVFSNFCRHSFPGWLEWCHTKNTNKFNFFNFLTDGYDRAYRLQNS